jgi:hypothetical protein
MSLKLAPETTAQCSIHADGNCQLLIDPESAVVFSLETEVFAQCSRRGHATASASEDDKPGRGNNLQIIRKFQDVNDLPDEFEVRVLVGRVGTR